MTLAAKRVTTTVPIVMAGSTDPVEAGIVASLARPGGNVTGFTQFEYSLRVRPRASSRITKFSQHETDGREFQEGESVAVEIFPVLGKAAATVEPRNRAFDDPTLG